MGCDFIQQRLYNFQGTGQADPSIPLDFLGLMRQKCPESINTSRSVVSSGASFDTHYYQRLLRGRGLLFSDQQLMAEEKTARLVSAYASDDGSTFRMDFARAMFKMSNLDVLTGLQGQVRLNCSKPLSVSVTS